MGNLIQGRDIKEFLLRTIDEHETGKSSHWQEQLDGYSYDRNEGLKGVLGFGSYEEKSKWKYIFHWLLQIPYKIRAESYRDLYGVLKSAKYIAEQQNRALNMDILRQVLTVVLCKNRIPHFEGNGVSVVIGDGFGVLSSLLYLTTANKIIGINLTPVLLADYLYTCNIIDDQAVVLAETEAGLDEALNSSQVRLVMIRSKNQRLLRDLKIHVAFNINSMGEMNPPIIRRYFDDLRHCKSEELYFYCCNREDKTLPDGTNTKFSEYPWSDNDEIILDELCPWNQTYYQKGRPFYRRFAGSVRHRIAKFNNRI
jgi:hypothetical protein